MSVTIKQNSGFFSCCSIRLNRIVDYINLHLKIPDKVDSSEQFIWYKNSGNNNDITYDYFEHYENIQEDVQPPIRYHHGFQFHNYSNLNYKAITPVVQKYFSPSKNIIQIIDNMKKKYKLQYNNICVLFYRGNDKSKETKLCQYDEYLTYANSILEQNPNIVFLIQSDETEFIEFMTNIYPNNSFYFKDETRHVNKCNSTVDKLMRNKNNEFSKYYLAITIIMSKCKYIICGSGNCSIWIMLYRGNNENVYQNLKGNWC